VLDDPESHLAGMIAEAKADPAQFILNRLDEAIDAATLAAWFPMSGLLDDPDTWEPPAKPVLAVIEPGAIERRWGTMLLVELRDMLQEGEGDAAEAVRREWRLNWASYGAANLVFEGMWTDPATIHVLEEKMDQCQRSRDNGAKNARNHLPLRDEIRTEVLALMNADGITFPIPGDQVKGIVLRLVDKGYARSTIYRAIRGF